MWVYRAHDSGSPIPCPYAKELRAFAQDIIFSRVTETTTVEEFARAQQNLLSRYLDLAEDLRTDTFHFPTAQTGRHRCLAAEYKETYHRLKNLSLMRNTSLPPAPPPRRQPPRSPDEVVNDITSLADEVKRPGDTFLGEER
jgi:hypothetical protein